jgi:hypothetical protein
MPGGTVTRRIRPLEPDAHRRPSMVELAAARDEARRRGDSRRALAYEVVRVQRLLRAQRDRQGGGLW